MVRGSRHREGACLRVMGTAKGTPEAELGTGIHSCHLPSLQTPGARHGGFPHCLTSEMARDRERSPGHGAQSPVDGVQREESHPGGQRDSRATTGQG